MRPLVLILSFSLVASLAPVAPSSAAPPAVAPSAAKDVAHDGVIAGVVINSVTRSPIRGALVVLSCSCLAAQRETVTNDNGLYRFSGLGPGTYDIQVLAGQAHVTKVVTVPKHVKLRANFSVDPANEFRRLIRVEAKTATRRTGRSMRMEEFRAVPARHRDFTSVVESPRHVTPSAAHPDLTQEEPSNREGYASIDENAFLDPTQHPLSTFSADVDTASFSNVRRFVAAGSMPPAEAVRVEELINYFPYSYGLPPDDRPIAVDWQIAECPWAPGHLLARVGLSTRPIPAARVPARNLVFLIDVSGSMEDADKLPLLQRSMMLLVDQLRPQDTVAIVVYAGAAGVVLPPTTGSKRANIREAIAELDPGGSTNGGAGIRQAYALARRSFVDGGINRVILATDGDFNVGTTSDGALTRLIEKQRDSGIFLSVLGFGQGNVQDATMELLADKGNGNYAYIDSLHEARKVLVEQAGATLVTVAKDVKLQAEINPAKVASYRLIGYENRKLADEDFADDRKDAGEMGAGHSVTALFELVPVGNKTDGGGESLRYQTPREATAAAKSDEWMTLAVRSKPADGDRSVLQRVVMSGRPMSFERASVDLRFAAAVAEYGMLLTKSKHAEKASYAHVLRVAKAATGDDSGGHRAAFVELVQATRRLSTRRRDD